MPRLMLLGAPGSGKGTQAAKISQAYGIPSISTGDELRAQLAAGSAIGKRAKSYMNSGDLVPDEIIIELVKGLFEKNGIGDGFLFDGFPRTIAQAEALDAFLAEIGKTLEKVFFLKVPKDVLIQRIANRRICPACGTTYHMSGRKPAVEGICDHCRIGLVQREDDEPETVGKRLEVYDEQTKPLIDYYKDKGILVELDGMQDVDTKQKQIDMALGAA